MLVLFVLGKVTSIDCSEVTVIAMIGSHLAMYVLVISELIQKILKTDTAIILRNTFKILRNLTFLEKIASVGPQSDFQANWSHRTELKCIHCSD